MPDTGPVDAAVHESDEDTCPSRMSHGEAARPEAAGKEF
jgi:hypothetical protein